MLIGTHMSPMKLLKLCASTVAIILLLWLVVPYFFHDTTSLQNETVHSPAGFQFEIVDTHAARTTGLSGRASVPKNYGMLFVFETADRHGFWMKDMLVPIDIVWLQKDGTIVDITVNITPETYPDVFYPREAVSYALETAVGEAHRQGWKPGDQIWLPR